MPLRLLLLALLCALAPASLAQDAPTQLHPGHPDLDTDRLGARADTLAVYIQQDGQTFTTGFIAVSAVFDEAGHLTRTETVLDPWSDPLWEERYRLDGATLRPLWQRTEAGDDFREVTFDAEAARLRQVEDGVETAREAVIEAPAFYASGLDLVLAALPLRGGYRAALHTIDAARLEQETRTLAVTAEGQTPDHSGVVHETWVVEVTTGGSTELYFVEQATGVLVRYEKPDEGMVFVRL